MAGKRNKLVAAAISLVLTVGFGAGGYMFMQKKMQQQEAVSNDIALFLDQGKTASALNGGENKKQTNSRVAMPGKQGGSSGLSLGHNEDERFEVMAALEGEKEGEKSVKSITGEKPGKNLGSDAGSKTVPPSKTQPAKPAPLPSSLSPLSSSQAAQDIARDIKDKGGRDGINQGAKTISSKSENQKTSVKSASKKKVENKLLTLPVQVKQANSSALNDARIVLKNAINRELEALQEYVMADYSPRINWTNPTIEGVGTRIGVERELAFTKKSLETKSRIISSQSAIIGKLLETYSNVEKTLYPPQKTVPKGSNRMDAKQLNQPWQQAIEEMKAIVAQNQKKDKKAGKSNNHSQANNPSAQLDNWIASINFLDQDAIWSEYGIFRPGDKIPVDKNARVLRWNVATGQIEVEMNGKKKMIALR